MFHSARMIGGRRHRHWADSPKLPALQFLGQRFLQAIPILGAGNLLGVRQVHPEDLPGRHLPPLGIVLRQRLGFRHALVIYNHHFFAGVARRRRRGPGQGQGRQD